MRIDRLLVHTIVLGGVVIMVGAVYLLVVLGLGDAPESPNDAARAVDASRPRSPRSLWVPVRTGWPNCANRRVYGERHAPDEVLRTFGAPAVAAIPLDELLLQLAESLKKSMELAAAEVWTGTGGVLELAVSVPYRGPPRIALDRRRGARRRAGGRVRATRGSQVWLPTLLAAHDGRTLRVAPVTHSGELLGHDRVRAAPTATCRSTRSDDQALTELARQVGLALHNVQLDSALQASLDELRSPTTSCARRVPASSRPPTPTRRQIERDLHDGAQQHLVALAVSSGWPASSRRRPRRPRRDARRARAATLQETVRSCATSRTASIRRC